jgi:hypothetical protein
MANTKLGENSALSSISQAKKTFSYQNSNQLDKIQLARGSVPGAKYKHNGQGEPKEMRRDP